MCIMRELPRNFQTFRHVFIPAVTSCPREIAFDGGITRSIMDNNYVAPEY